MKRVCIERKENLLVRNSIMQIIKEVNNKDLDTVFSKDYDIVGVLSIEQKIIRDINVKMVKNS